MKHIGIYFLLVLSSTGISQSNVITVAENTFKIGRLDEEIFYYAFTEGDRLIFSFQEMDNKELKEIEIIEYPSNSIFMEYKTKKIENKSFTISRTGVYKFRLNNGSLLGKICKIKIDRVPATDKTKAFNTSVKWIEKPDTTWNIYTKEVVAGYDTLLIPRTKKELVSTEQYEEPIMTKKQTVNSSTSIHGNKSSLFFTLPENLIMELNTKKVISWGYWVGVGEDANKAWQQNCRIMSSLVSGVITYETPLGGFLAGKLIELIVPKSGEDVVYGIVDTQNRDLFLQGVLYRSFDSGKGSVGYKKFTNEYMLNGTWYIILLNDNVITPIEVDVKVVAIIEKNTFEYRSYTEQKITPRYENRTFKDPIIKFAKVPVVIN